MKKFDFVSYILSFCIVSLITFAGEFLKRQLEPTNISMLYLLAVVFIAIRWGIGNAVFASFFSFLCFDFFLIPPYLTFTVAHIQYLFTLMGFLVVGIVISILASKMREAILRKQTEKLQTALLNSISHDLKTPLATITGSLTSIINGGDSLSENEKTDLINNSLRESRHLNRVVSDLLDITRIDAGALNICKKPCDLRDVLDSSIEQISDKIDGRKIQIEIDGNFPEIPMDYPFMMRVFYNLLDNCIKYTSNNGIISIRAAFEEKDIIIDFSDDGVGVPEENLKRIFNKFYRVKGADSIKGTGLGLSICKGIVESHKGAIVAKRNRDKGITVRIFLPRT